MCNKLGVSPGGYYAWLKRKKSQRCVDNEALLVEIKRIHQASHERYGYPRIHARLNQEGIRCGKHRVARIMRQNNIIGLKAKRFRNHKYKHHIASNSHNLLLDRPPETSINQVWVGDITFIRVNKESTYLSVVMDRYSRKIIGWTFQKHRGAEFVAESLIMAANSQAHTCDTIFHSDQGSEYASKIHTALLRELNIKMSMSRKGHCWDNAHMESFFHSLKTEMVYFHEFKTLEEAMSYIIDYIYFYNNERIHSGINYLTPVACELMVA